MNVDLQDPHAVQALFHAAARANLGAPCRRGSIDLISAPGTLIASGDLHDNPAHLARLASLAGLDESAEAGQPAPSPAHLTLHEIIHSDRLVGGMDLSYRALARAADLKIRHPEHVHTLLANHELAQIAGAGIVKDGLNVVRAFNDALEYVFGDQAAPVEQSIGDFIRSMPLALRCERTSGGAAGGEGREGGEGGDILCAHSLPSPFLFDRFDPGVLERDLEETDYAPRRGSAHIMVWGRSHTPELLGSLAERWGVSIFILGHEKAEEGFLVRPPNTLILNSDHARGAYLPLDLAAPPAFADIASHVRPLSAR